MNIHCEFSSRFHSDSKRIRSGFESKRRESPRIHNVFAQQYGFANFGGVFTVIRCETLSWVARGSFTFVYGSPETLVGKPMRRSVLSSDVYVSRVVAVVVDEAHTVVHWYEFNDSVMRLVYGLVVLQGSH